MFFKRRRRKRINDILENIEKKDLFKRYFLLALGCFIVAFAFNVFFKQYENITEMINTCMKLLSNWITSDKRRINNILG